MKSEIESCRVCFCFLCQRFSTQPSFPNPASNPGNVFCLSHHISIQTKSRGRAGFGPGFQILGLHQNSCAQTFKNEIEICRACFCFLCQRFSTQPSFPNPASNPAGNSWEETLKHKVCLAIDWHNYVWNCKSTDDVFKYNIYDQTNRDEPRRTENLTNSASGRDNRQTYPIATQWSDRWLPYVSNMSIADAPWCSRS